jgi:hypothetical protein
LEQCRRFEFKKFHELRGGTTKSLGSELTVELADEDDVECFSQEGREIAVACVHRYLLPLESRLPQEASRSLNSKCVIGNRADFKGEFHAQTMDGHLLIRQLTTALARLAAEAARLMRDDDRGFHLVAMLAAWAAAPLATHIALRKQRFDS